MNLRGLTERVAQSKDLIEVELPHNIYPFMAFSRCAPYDPSLEGLVMGHDLRISVKAPTHIELLNRRQGAVIQLRPEDLLDFWRRSASIGNHAF